MTHFHTNPQLWSTLDNNNINTFSRPNYSFFIIFLSSIGSTENALSGAFTNLPYNEALFRLPKPFKTNPSLFSKITTSFFSGISIINLFMYIPYLAVSAMIVVYNKSFFSKISKNSGRYIFLTGLYILGYMLWDKELIIFESISWSRLSIISDITILNLSSSI